jgi:DNA-binding CsgD family transcriptional regulator
VVCPEKVGTAALTELGDVLRDALDGVEQLERAQTADAVLGTMTNLLKPFGSEFFCLYMLPQPGQKFEEVMLAQRVPPGWLKLYLDENFAAADPVMRHCRHTVHPFELRSAPYDLETEPARAKVARTACEFHIGGLVVPVASPSGTQGSVWIDGNNFAVEPHEWPLVHMLSLYAFERVRALCGRSCTKPPPITPREKEVLSWTAAGKSAWEIGEILGIAKRTVDAHAQTAMRKLGAVNRVQTVALAIRGRIIEP